ncbi:MAG: Gfo/Idh/MocA family oxidoreductase [Bacteroidota bacterium]
MKKLSRRSFVKSTATASAGLMIVPHMMSYSPANKLNLAFIGVGGRGGRNIKSCDIKTKKGVATNNIVALCDVSDERAANGYKAYPKAKRFTDFREMFDKMGKEIDAVVISTPDHTHFAATMAAMELGKHVYVEKPLAHNIWQLRTLKKAAKHYDVITQMGNQGHTTEGIRRVKEWYEAGVLGEVTEVIAWFNGPHFARNAYFYKPVEFPVKAEAVPSGLDWDSWLGPVSMRPYSQYYLPKLWRGWYEFGGAELGDWACHTLDAPFWTLDLGMPTSVDSLYRSPTPPDKDFISDSSRLRFNFPARGDKAAVTLNWYEGGLKPPSRPEWNRKDLPKSGMIMVGSKVSLMTGGRPNKPELLLPKKEWEEFQRNMPKQTIPRVAEEDPQGEWIRAIKKEGPMPGSQFEYGASLTEMALVGVLAQRFGVRIEYDAEQMKVTNHKDFDQYIKEPVREGWAYGENL